METIEIKESRIIDAPPAAVHAVLADYRAGHAAILPQPYFKAMTVEEGGFGAGTVLRVQMEVMGRTFHYHQRVTEPEPGRVLVETDVDTGEWSSFTLDPLDNGRCTQVTITACQHIKPGFEGIMQRIAQPGIVRRIFRKELQNLADYLIDQKSE